MTLQQLSIGQLPIQIAAHQTQLKDIQAQMDRLIAVKDGLFDQIKFNDLLDEAFDVAERIEILELELDFLEEQAYDSTEDEGSTLD